MGEDWVGELKPPAHHCCAPGSGQATATSRKQQHTHSTGSFPHCDGIPCHGGRRPPERAPRHGTWSPPTPLPPPERINPPQQPTRAACLLPAPSRLPKGLGIPCLCFRSRSSLPPPPTFSHSVPMSSALKAHPSVGADLLLLCCRVLINHPKQSYRLLHALPPRAAPTSSLHSLLCSSPTSALFSTSGCGSCSAPWRCLSWTRVPSESTHRISRAAVCIHPGAAGCLQSFSSPTVSQP